MARDFSRWASWRGVLVLVAGFVFLYAQSIRFDYVFDDISAVRDNPAFEKPLSEALLMTQHEHHQSIRSEVRSTSHDSFRPLRHLSLWLDHSLFGKSAAAFHAHNVLVGGAAIGLLWLFLQHWPLSPWARIAVTGAFAFHPAQVESVAYISGRSDVEAAVFALLALIFGYRFLDASSWRERAWPLFGAAMAFLLCLAQKESFVLLPALLLFPRQMRSAPKWSVLSVWLVVAAITVATWFAFRSSVISGAAPLDISGGLSAIGRGMRQAFLVVVFPVPSSPVRPFLDGEPWVETVLYGLGGLACVVGALSSRKGTVRTVCFGMIWFSILIGPSLVAAFLFDVFSDHYLYLPAVGVFMAAAAILEMALGFLGTRAPQMSEGARNAVVWGPVVLLEVVWIGITASRIPAWENPRSLAELCVESHPEVGRGWVWLAESAGKTATCQEIVKYYEKSVEVDPDYAPAWNNLAVCALRSGSLKKAEDHAKKAILLSNGTSISSWYNYGLILEGLKKYESACNAQRSVLKLDSQHKGGLQALQRVCRE